MKQFKGFVKIVLPACLLILLFAVVMGRSSKGRASDNFTTTGQYSEAAAVDARKDEPTAGYWTCSMHPEVRQPQKGDCPICGMKLIFKRKDQDTSSIKRIAQDRGRPQLGGTY